MRIYIESKPVLGGTVVFDYRDFSISLQQNFEPHSLAVFFEDDGDQQCLGRDFAVTPDGIRDAMTLIDHYHLSRMVAGD